MIDPVKLAVDVGVIVPALLRVPLSENIMLSANAAMGIAKASKAIKTTRLINPPVFETTKLVTSFLQGLANEHRQQLALACALQQPKSG